LDLPARSPSVFRHRAVLAGVAAALIAAAWTSGVFQAFHDPEKVRALLGAWGPWAYVVYLASFILLMPFGIPAFVWVLPAGILWPFWIAFPLSMVAVAGGSSVGFLFARYLAHDWVSARLPRRIRRLDERFCSRGLRSVIVFRLIFQLGAPTHWLLGLSKIGYGTFVLGTVIGAAPVVALVAWFGHDAFLWVEAHGALAAGILAGVVLVVIVSRRMMAARRV
jgi:uncharacterized membrane protein YdjX (TVP38/TMEM64 family)